MPNMAAGWGGAVERLFHRLPSALDLRDEVQLESMLELSDRLIARVEREVEAADGISWTSSRRLVAADRLVLSQTLLLGDFRGVACCHL